MKVFSVVGISKSGKTTTIERIIAELRRRGYTVGSVKEIHFHDFKMDVSGTNTDRHRAAGADPVTARGDQETDIMFGKKLKLMDVLKFYDCDYVVLEGVRDTAAPKIVTAHDILGIEDRLDETAFAISGRVSEKIGDYKGLPVINALSDIDRLVDLIETKVFDHLLSAEDGCCKGCGMTCSQFSAAVLRGERKRSECVADMSPITLKSGGREIPMVPFVQRLLRNAVLGVVSELDGCFDAEDIEICIKR